MRLRTVVLLALSAGLTWAGGTVYITGTDFGLTGQTGFYLTSSDPLTGLSASDSGSANCVSTQMSVAAGGGLLAPSAQGAHCGFGNYARVGVEGNYQVPFTLTSAITQNVDVSLNLVSRASTNGGTCVSAGFMYQLSSTFGTGQLFYSYPGSVSRAGNIFLPNADGTAAPITTPSVQLATNTPRTLLLSTVLDLSTGGNGCLITADVVLTFPTNGPVFNLPQGVDVDIPELNIFNNRWRDPRVSVAPLSLNFGSVAVGTKTFQMGTLANQQTLQNQALDIYSVSVDAPANGFSTLVLGSPVSVPVGGTFDIPVQFLPSVTGPASNTLHIVTGASTVDVPLSGTGVNSAPPPQQQITDILNFFDNAVNLGALTGNGPGSSGINRRNALRNMIEAAGDLIQQGTIGEACTQLKDALNRTDGNPQPPDFVAGPAAPELMQKLQSLLSTLGCAP